MIYTQLSEQEQADLVQLVQQQASLGVVQYVNRLLKKGSWGNESCARPFAARDEKHVKQPCFAQGYLEKSLEYSRDCSYRLPASEALEKTQHILEQMITEVKTFF